ncbi:MAG: hypothetical protein ABFS39_03905 [Pseudomonadota bacterium]
MLLVSPGCIAGVCTGIEAKNSLTNNDRASSSYFDEYLVRERHDVYFVYASKQVLLDLALARKVMSDLESHPNFIPGYQSIQVITGPDNEILTGLRFRAPFSPFSSRLTNQVEINDEQDRYKQCWEQLEADDSRVLEPHKNAPNINMGYWWFVRLSESSVKIHYFSIVRPPLAIPTWLYTRIVKGSYEDLFERIIERTRQMGENVLWDDKNAEPESRRHTPN